MYAPIAVLVAATALFAAGIVWRRVRRPGAPAATTGLGALDLDQLQGFVFVGSGTLVLLAVAVVVVGLTGRAGQAEAMGVLGLIAYLVYLLVAVALISRTARRAARRAVSGGRSA
ncbi:hypothetical protein [Microlunatus flavus]|uniref:Uncharacterized protein n=1 Tax=Microlunatus flavus TaxID=1036181 RepID=A0A1H8Z6A1_9ACTN|nr:hypothetical protein [Microlunatus flavus]SEP59863.1 hypothetical protein SAMN05421756_101113 [Microlunatus flavus]